MVVSIISIELKYFCFCIYFKETAAYIDKDRLSVLRFSHDKNVGGSVEANKSFLGPLVLYEFLTPAEPIIKGTGIF